jgi:hypothetical protein
MSPLWAVICLLRTEILLDGCLEWIGFDTLHSIHSIGKSLLTADH